MTQPLIAARKVRKRFRRRAHHDSLRDWLAAALSFRSQTGLRADDFWAVDDLSFEVRPGEALGIIGPNGAGKSTMLKLLAGIMRPTQGVIDVRGRVSALIELGAGFHGDLTGRENIFLNASILGMSRREARLKFNDIVEFAGIDEFLDMPVKRYSSGMHARLGFAIAAHVSPQVMLVDEVLSVGDRVFRSRCMERMNRFLKQGVAIVFVSHDLGSVGRFCDRTLVLDRGQERFCGPSAEAIARYYETCADSLLLRETNGQSLVKVREARLLEPSGSDAGNIQPGDRLVLELEAQFDVDMPRPSFGLSIVRMEDHQTVFETSSTRLGHETTPARRGDRRRVRYEFEMNVLPGEYAIGYHVRDRDSLSYVAHDPYAVRIMVGGANDAGGVVHVSPVVEVQAVNVEKEPQAAARLV